MSRENARSTAMLPRGAARYAPRDGEYCPLRPYSPLPSKTRARRSQAGIERRGHAIANHREIKFLARCRALRTEMLFAVVRRSSGFENRSSVLGWGQREGGVAGRKHRSCEKWFRRVDRPFDGARRDAKRAARDGNYCEGRAISSAARFVLLRPNRQLRTHSP